MAVSFLVRNTTVFKPHLIVYLAIILFISCRKENIDLYIYPEKSAVIKELILDSKQIGPVKNFWIDRLGCELINQTSKSFTILAGETRLTFRYPDPDNAMFNAFYHFAINIPENQIESAFDWMKTLAKVIPSSETGSEIIHKSKFNAHSIYFRDPGGNIIELIARHDLKNSASGIFSPEMFLNISDVTVVTRNVKDCAELLKDTFGLKELSGTSNSYKPTGGKDGMLTLMVYSRAIPPTDDITAFPFRMEVIIQNPENLNIELPGSRTIIRTEP